jgi:hypothetical protein
VSCFRFGPLVHWFSTFLKQNMWLHNFLIFFSRNYQREAELARMAWKVKPEDLLPAHLGARGNMGSRYSLGRLSLPVIWIDG